MGSPPRVRGKVAGYEVDVKVNGITPAYAGKRLFQLHGVYLCRDHPRVCGEKIHSTKNCFPVLGSPPRMRGRESDGYATAKDYGITPAYAGKRQPCSET